MRGNPKGIALSPGLFDSAGDSIPRLDWDAECYLTILL